MNGKNDENLFRGTIVKSKNTSNEHMSFVHRTDMIQTYLFETGVKNATVTNSKKKSPDHAT